MKDFKKPILKLLNEENIYEKDFSYYNSVICYISYLKKITETDYIIYHDNRKFEYTPQFYSFIQVLYKADLVATHEQVQEFLKTYDCIKTEKCSCFNLWVKDMNKIISSDDLIQLTNLSFIRIALATMLSLEKMLPGSWGIDIENGNWLRILQQLKNIYFQIYKPAKNDIC